MRDLQRGARRAVAGPLDRDALRQALGAVFERHEALAHGPLVRVTRPRSRSSSTTGRRAPARRPLAPPAAERGRGAGAAHPRARAAGRSTCRRDLMLRATLFELADDEHVAPLPAAPRRGRRLVGRHPLPRARRALRRAAERPAAEAPGAAAAVPRLRGLAARSPARAKSSRRSSGTGATQLAGAPTVLRAAGRSPPPAAADLRRGEPRRRRCPRGRSTASRQLCRTPQRDAVHAPARGLRHAALPPHRARTTSSSAARWRTAGRAEFEPLIGFFANTIVLRVRLGGNPPFATLLERVRETRARRVRPPGVPFEQIVEAVRPAARPRRQPALPGELPRPGRRAAAARAERRDDEPASGRRRARRASTSRSSCSWTTRASSAELIYNTDLFDQATVEGLQRRLRGAPGPGARGSDDAPPELRPPERGRRPGERPGCARGRHPSVPRGRGPVR